MALPPITANRIIIAPLNWGLGHATRSIPIIRHLIDCGKEVIIASDGEPLELLREEFPHLPAEVLPSYNVSYSGDTLWSIVWQNGWNVMKAITEEKSYANRIVKKHKAEMIISDSRFGFRNKKIPSVIISHQLRPFAPSQWMQHLLSIYNSYFLNAFDEVWVPDYNDHRLSGALSKSEKIKKKRFVGPLSRFEKKDISKKYDVAIVLSGPEPARSKLEKLLLKKYDNSLKSICLVRGTTKAKKLATNTPHLTIIDRANSDQLNEILSASRHVISRSGYSSIMDYEKLGIKAEMIATPGQTEQEYLMKYHAKT